MIRSRKTRIEALEQAHADRLPLLPALVIWADTDANTQRLAYRDRHGREPDVVLSITVVDSSVPAPDIEGATPCRC